MRLNIILIILTITFLGSKLITSCRCIKEENNNATITDIDGNLYHTVKIDTLIWMVENLRTTKYQNGDPIEEVIDATRWINLNSGAYCYYNNDPNNISIYGLLYNWNAVNDNRNLAPKGWHVASKDEWSSLINYLGGINVAGGKLKEIGTKHWKNPNVDATNESGFNALPGGLRYKDGTFMHITTNAYWWLSTEYDANNAWFTIITNNVTGVGLGMYGIKTSGLSVRCVKD